VRGIVAATGKIMMLSKMNLFPFSYTDAEGKLLELLDKIAKLQTKAKRQQSNSNGNLQRQLATATATVNGKW